MSGKTYQPSDGAAKRNADGVKRGLTEPGGFRGGGPDGDIHPDGPGGQPIDEYQGYVGRKGAAAALYLSRPATRHVFGRRLRTSKIHPIHPEKERKGKRIIAVREGRVREMQMPGLGREGAARNGALLQAS